MCVCGGGIYVCVCMWGGWDTAQIELDAEAEAWKQAQINKRAEQEVEGLG